MDTNNTIRSLKGPDRVRKRPAVVFGSVGIDGATSAIKNLIRIFVNEATQGFCKQISVNVGVDNSVCIKSFDRGFALSQEEIEGKPLWHYDFCELYFPFDTDNDYYFELGVNHNRLYGSTTTSYLQTEGDSHFDLTCTQYVSEYMLVSVKRDNVLKELRFEKGVCVEDLKLSKAFGESYTQITLRLDAEVFGTNEINKDEITDYLQIGAITIPELRCEFNDAFNGSACTFYYPKGTREYFDEHIGNRKHTDVFQKEFLVSGKDRYNGREYTSFAKLSLCFAEEPQTSMCVHNYQNLSYGGTHLETIQARITNYFNWYFSDEFGEKYTYEDIAKYLTIVVETRCENFATQWMNGARKSISNRMITDMCQDMVDEDFRYYLKLHRTEIIGIITNTSAANIRG